MHSFKKGKLTSSCKQRMTNLGYVYIYTGNIQMDLTDFPNLELLLSLDILDIRIHFDSRFVSLKIVERLLPFWT